MLGCVTQTRNSYLPFNDSKPLLTNVWEPFWKMTRQPNITSVKWKRRLRNTHQMRIKLKIMSISKLGHSRGSQESTVLAKPERTHWKRYQQRTGHFHRNKEAVKLRNKANRMTAMLCLLLGLRIEGIQNEMFIIVNPHIFAIIETTHVDKNTFLKNKAT